MTGRAICAAVAVLVAIFVGGAAAGAPDGALPLATGDASVQSGGPADGLQPALLVIDAAIASGRLETARDIIARTAVRYDDPELRLRAAELALASDALVQAAAGFSTLANNPGTAARAQQGLGLARFRQGDMVAAKTALAAAVASDARLIRSWVALAVIADRARDFGAADAAYARALAIDGASAAALTNRGYSLLLRGRLVEAEADLVRATAIDPKSAVAATNLRMARAMQGRYREAFAGSTKETLAADLNTVGFGAMARGDLHTAETYFNRALTLDTHFDPVAWANLRYLKSLTQPLGTGVPENATRN